MMWTDACERAGLPNPHPVAAAMFQVAISVHGERLRITAPHGYRWPIGASHGVCIRCYSYRDTTTRYTQRQRCCSNRQHVIHNQACWHKGCAEALSVWGAGGDPKLFMKESPVTLSTLVYDVFRACNCNICVVLERPKRG